MTKKFLAVTLVLVLAAGFMAVAAEHEDERPLTGEWENTLSVTPTQPDYYWPVNSPISYSSELSVSYLAGGVTFDVGASFGYNPGILETSTYFEETSNDFPDDISAPPYSESNGLTEMSFGAEATVGLLDLSSTAIFEPGKELRYPLQVDEGEYEWDKVEHDPGLKYWESSASLTLGGVSITDTFVLQPVMEEQTGSTVAFYSYGNFKRGGFTYTEGAWFVTKEDTEWTNMVASDTLGAGMNLKFSGETPGGVSVTVENLFGMEKVTDLGTSWSSYLTKTGRVSGEVFGIGSIPYETGYNIVTKHHPDDDEDTYGASSMQYVMSILTLENMSLGCCDFSSETMFSEANGFEYTAFDFTLESSSMPLSLDGNIMFTAQTKSVHLEPSLDVGWACFDVYTGLTPDLSNNSDQNSTIESFEVRGFSITGVELGHVEFSSYTALGSHTLNSMVQAPKFRFGYDELVRIDKLEEYPLDFTLDTYFNMSNGGLFDLALFDGTMEYELDDEFTVGTGVSIKPNDGLQTFDFTFDYSF